MLVAVAVLAGFLHPLAAQSGSEVIRASRVLDGRGAVLEDRDIVVRDGNIVGVVSVGEGRADRVHDLTGLTVLPGLIDTHVHLGWHFDGDGRGGLSDSDG